MKQGWLTFAAVVSALAFSPALAQQVEYYRFRPMVVPVSYTGNVVLEAKIILGTADSVKLELASTGQKVPLVDDGSGADAAAGDGLYTVSLSAVNALYDYAADDVNRNFVGYLGLYSGATRLKYRNVFVDVLTPDIPAVTVNAVSPTIQYSEHLVNIADSAFYSGYDLTRVTRTFYAQFADNFDFINIVYEIPHMESRHHSIVTRNVSGIGHECLPSVAGTFGSAGRLLGYTVFPIPTLFDGASSGYVHELGHQWINYLDIPPLNDIWGGHWPLSDLAAGIMGYSDRSNGQGLNFNYDLVPDGGNYRLVWNSQPKGYTDLGLYLMGLAAPSEVGSHFVFDDQTQTVTGVMLSGPVTTVTIADIISAYGPRDPDHTAAQKKFRVATILVSRDGLVSNDVMRLYDHFAARAEGTSTVPVHEGLITGSANPFYVATGGRGRLDTRIMPKVLVDASRDGGVWWYPQSGPFDPAAAHQGKALADYLRSDGYIVDELPRPSTVTGALLGDYDVVIRAVGFQAYAADEITAYKTYVYTGGNLLLLADHFIHAPRDELASGFGLHFAGVTRGDNLLSNYMAHPVTDGVGPLPYTVGSGLVSTPASARILGRLSPGSYLDLNNNDMQDTGEPSAPNVLGVMSYGSGQIVFSGDTNVWLGVPRPLVENLLAWFDNETSRECPRTRPP